VRWWVGLLAAAAALGQQRSFVACPVVRDTKTVPCFLADYDGETYFLGVQGDITSDFHPPQLKHEVLVEGRVAEGPRVCGGIPLRPVSISVRKEVSLACNTLLPAEPGIEAPPTPRGAGPASRRPEEGSVVRPPRTGRQEFTLLFAFDDDYVDYAADQTVTEAAAYAQQIHASSVKVSGYRATSLLSNGQRLVEKTGLAERRARAIATLLRGLGVAAVSVEWTTDAEPADGQTDPSHRCVAIVITP